MTISSKDKNISDSNAKSRRRVNHTPLKRGKLTSEIPASNLQEALYLSHLLHPESVSFNVANLLEIEGNVDVSIFCQAFEAELKIHEIFRTHFRLSEDKVCQVIIPEDQFAFKLNFEDLSGLPPEAQSETLRQEFDDCRLTKYDLNRPPLYRFKLFKLDAEKFALVRGAHHAVSDATTNRMLLNEVSARCEAAAQNVPHVVSRPEFNFADFAVWERENLSVETLAPQMEYWREVYKNPPPPLKLPTGKLSSVVGGAFCLSAMKIDRELWSQIKSLTTIESASTFQINLSILAVFLYRLSGASDFFVGSSIDLRRLRGLEGVYGPLISEFVIRFEMHGEMSFIELLRGVIKKSKTAYVNCDIDFERLISCVGGDRLEGHYPLYQVEFFCSKKIIEIQNEYLKFSVLLKERGAGDVDLFIELVDSGDHAEVVFRYNSSLFLPSVVDEMVAALSMVYVKVGQDPLSPIAEIAQSSYLSQTSQELGTDERSVPPCEVPREEPRVGIESDLAGIWREVLKIEEIGRHDSFFKLGGTPSDILKVSAKLKENGLVIDFRELYFQPILVQMAELIAGKIEAARPKAA